MLKIEYVDIDSIKPYPSNAKLHPAEQIEQIKESIKEFGFNDPIAVDKDNEIIEGHGRYIACKELDIKEIPIIRLDNLTDEQKRAYMLIHNKLTMNTDFDIELLNEELENIFEIDMSKFDFVLDNIDYEELLSDNEEDLEKDYDEYSTKAERPQYNITGKDVKIEELIDEQKYNKLIDKIQKASITEEQKNFLIKAATRHYVFNYANIAEYYANQNKEMQELMEESAMVIIDINDAIKNGYIELSKDIEQLMKETGIDTYKE